MSPAKNHTQRLSHWHHLPHSCSRSCPSLSSCSTGLDLEIFTPAAAERNLILPGPQRQGIDASGPHSQACPPASTSVPIGSAGDPAVIDRAAGTWGTPSGCGEPLHGCSTLVPQQHPQHKRRDGGFRVKHLDPWGLVGSRRCSCRCRRGEKETCPVLVMAIPMSPVSPVPSTTLGMTQAFTLAANPALARPFLPAKPSL